MDPSQLEGKSSLAGRAVQQDGGVQAEWAAVVCLYKIDEVCEAAGSHHEQHHADAQGVTAESPDQQRRSPLLPLDAWLPRAARERLRGRAAPG